MGAVIAAVIISMLINAKTNTKIIECNKDKTSVACQDAKKAIGEQ